ncbi:MAG: type II secretion system protein [Phycisphaerae bacterium]
MKNKQQTMNKQQRTRRAFTLIELVVSVALLGIIFLFAGIIFKVSINSYRTAIANTDIMQKFRAITDQLDADFEGAQLSAGGNVTFGLITGGSVIDGQAEDIRSDSIVIFSTGDFQTSRQYNSKTVVGNAAAIFYGLANIPGPNTNPREKVLTRRQTIFTSDSSLTLTNLGARAEYCNQETLADVIAYNAEGDTTLVDSLMVRPEWDPTNFNPNNLVYYMAKGVDDFAIQYIGWESPYLGRAFNDWRPVDSEVPGWASDPSPQALKFSFTLYDSRGIIKKGRRFTHIVYLRE